MGSQVWLACGSAGRNRDKRNRQTGPGDGNIDMANRNDASDANDARGAGDAGGANDARERLHSWKEIAAFLGHGVRSAQRWERERGLPVHRTPGGKLGSVYAFKRELAQWMRREEDQVREEAGSTAQAAAESSATAAPNASWSSLDETRPGTRPGAQPDTQLVAQAAGDGMGIAPEAFAPPAPEMRSRFATYLYRWKPLLGAALLVAALPLVLVWLANMDSVAGSTAHTHAPETAAVDLYLQGRYFWEKRDPADLERAVDLYTQAIVLDPQYAQPYAGLADCYNLLREFSTMPPEEAYPRALAAAGRAVQLDPDSAEAHNALAFGTYWWKWDPATSDREFQRAIELKPNLAVAHHWYANTLMSRDRGVEALHEIEVAQALDPSSTAILGSKGLILIVDGKQDAGIALLEQLEAAQPDYLPPHLYLAQVFLDRGEALRFIAEQKFIAERTGNPLQAALAGAAARGYASGGSDGMIRAMLDALKKHPEAGAHSYVMMARLYALEGRQVAALESLKSAYLHHEEGVSSLSADAAFTALRSDREFQQMAAFDWHPSAHPSAPESSLPVIAASAGLPSPAGK
jgi:tetratricopeptide (TPR) repeat protein